MAERISMEKAVKDKSRLQDLFSLPATNRQHLKITHRALHEVIAEELTPRQREMLLLFYYEQKSVSAIAAELHVNPSTVSRTLRRAENRIRRSMRFYFDIRNVVLEDES